MSDSLSNAAPVGPIGGFPSRSPQDMTRRQHQSGAQDEPLPESAKDGVDLHSGADVARRLLRERVLARTRDLLDLTPGEFVPSFAEAVDAEPIHAFLGRLLGAQNQLAALRVRKLAPVAIRARLDRALRDGVSEVMEMLASDSAAGAVGCAVVADVLAEYGRRLAELANEPE
jgi:hypothetical protein